MRPSGLMRARRSVPWGLGGRTPRLPPIPVTSVLIADNDSAVSDLLTQVLTRAGLAVAHAYDGEVAIELARDPVVRVFVCDLDMPRASGIEVLEALGAMAAPPATIVITGFLELAVLERLQAMPFVRDVLRKPFDLLQFAARVQALLAPPATDAVLCAEA
jgi:DNA-binding response OmpR family regulator